MKSLIEINQNIYNIYGKIVRFRWRKTCTDSDNGGWKRTSKVFQCESIIFQAFWVSSSTWASVMKAGFISSSSAVEAPVGMILCHTIWWPMDITENWWWFQWNFWLNFWGRSLWKFPHFDGVCAVLCDLFHFFLLTFHTWLPSLLRRPTKKCRIIPKMPQKKLGRSPASCMFHFVFILWSTAWCENERLNNCVEEELKTIQCHVTTAGESPDQSKAGSTLSNRFMHQLQGCLNQKNTQRPVFPWDFGDDELRDGPTEVSLLFIQATVATWKCQCFNQILQDQGFLQLRLFQFQILIKFLVVPFVPSVFQVFHGVFSNVFWSNLLAKAPEKETTDPPGARTTTCSWPTSMFLTVGNNKSTKSFRAAETSRFLETVWIKMCHTHLPQTFLETSDIIWLFVANQFGVFCCFLHLLGLVYSQHLVVVFRDELCIEICMMDIEICIEI